ncbi:DUF3078 domain-containing protein [candidate division WOR-3 bacterium]|uniref:DUF3078 domain-containing protein n=1 Tax=candidate division WOR-3 bacterium TaxID=2052148 RepID=A0A9D5QDD5_UNCW3|nr:DUF3078 domain-containing protein [candidate division WOR-3 bacterium]MBD3364946.1 DUF3078 domain-containing protein [candidate division WOR-3 bacterium]
MRRIIIAVLVLAATTFALDPWEASVDANLTLTQNAYSDNWAGEETGALSWTLAFNSIVQKQLVDWLHNRNTGNLAFGQIYSQDKETKVWSDPAKSSDLIDLESVFRFTLQGFVDPFAGARIESQFVDANDSLNVRYINPATFT